MASEHQQQQLRGTPLFFAGQVAAQRVMSERISLRIFAKPLEKLGVCA
jgi:hypothetical protein